LLAAVIVKHRAVGPAAAWLAQQGVSKESSDGGREDAQVRCPTQSPQAR
jgi:hypothetical protein